MLLSDERPNRGSLCLVMTKGHVAALYGLVRAVLAASVWNMADGLLRFPRNLGESYFFAPRQFPVGDTGLPTPGLGGRTRPPRSERTSATEVSPSEGNEVRRDGGRMT